ncbi:uncharacterized protein MOG isoform X5 [Gallus gallus]|uniref:uncharacterized protein MOG isoform X5 n=1 Tax=Gallus gallus TaxID=9031 RepID=UPI001AE83665|nr:uncharacterized protein MOG isoform X5 [Gallus gallus]
MPALFPLPTLLRVTAPPERTARRSALLSFSFLELLFAQMWFVSGCKQSSFALPWRTLLAYLVALNLLCPGSAKLRVVALNFPVTATVGQDVVLHCHLSPCKDARSLDIRWIQHRSSGLVHHYQNGEDLEQMEEYKGRTELLRDGLSDGNLYLHITAVSSSDSGSYMCTVQDDGGYVEAMVNLQVSDPFSHIVHPWKVALAVVLTLLFASFVIIVFLHRKQAAQTKNLKIKDAVLEELPVILVKKIEEFEKENSQLKKQVAELVEQIEEFEKENSQLKKQVAELVEQIEEFGESSSLNQRNMGLTRECVDFSFFFFFSFFAEKENSQLKEHYMKMVLSAADLKKQVAELELGESSPNQRNMGFPTG